MVTSMRGCGSNIRAGVIIAMAMASTALTAQSTRPQRPGSLGQGQAGVSEERCDEIANELSRVGFQIGDAQDRMAERAEELRGDLRARLNAFRRIEALLKQEQLGCAIGRGPLGGSVTSDGAPAPPPPSGLPGAPAESAAPTPSPQPLGGSAATAGATPAASGGGVPWPAGVPTNAAGSSMPWGAADRGLKGEAAKDRCRQLYDGAVRLREQAAEIRTLESDLVAMKPDSRDGLVPRLDTAERATAFARLAELKPQQTYIATQISILEESMEGIRGCDPSTGKVAAPAVPSGLAGTKRTPDAPPANVPAPPAVATTPPAATAGFAGVWNTKVLTAMKLQVALTAPEPPPPPPPPGVPPGATWNWATTLGMLNLRPIDRDSGEFLAVKEYGGVALGKCAAGAQYYEGEFTWAAGGFFDAGVAMLRQSQRSKLTSRPDRAKVIGCENNGYVKGRFDGPPEVPQLSGSFEMGRDFLGDFSFSGSGGGRLRAVQQ